MNDQDLRKRLIRLAHAQPHLREHVLPLLRKEAEAATLPLTEMGYNIRDARAMLALARGSFSEMDFRSNLAALSPSDRAKGEAIWDAIESSR